MNKTQFMAKYCKDKGIEYIKPITEQEAKAIQKRKDIDINNCIADGCTRAWNSQRIRYRQGQR